MKIIVTGSLAYDYIMNFPGHFKDHILPEKVHMLTVSFLVDSMKRMRGGVAGNIAYTLALLGEQPWVVAPVGHDFADYRNWMEKAGINVHGLKVVEHEFTASCFINTDQSHNQIVAFYPGAMGHARDLSLKGLGLTRDDLVIISPTEPEAIVRYARECREMGVPYLFDPGKQTPRLEKEQIIEGLMGASVLIGNDYEFAMMAQKTGLSEQKLIESSPLTVVTRGAQGSTIYSQERSGPLEVPIAPVSSVVDPTGAGDAYLGGLVFGLARGFPIEVTGRIAALAASFVIEHKGCQEHHYSTQQFSARYIQAFGPSAEIATLAA